jgi:hypothetical protein
LSWVLQGIFTCCDFYGRQNFYIVMEHAMKPHNTSNYSSMLRGHATGNVNNFETELMSLKSGACSLFRIYFSQNITYA